MHPENTQSLVSKLSNDKPSSPGALRGQTWLTVQTRQAQRLIRGRSSTVDKPAIVGLMGFADRLRLIWQAARHDDPYADWWLIKVHEALEHSRELVQTEQSRLDALLAQSQAIEVTVAESLRPFRIALQFANPYAYRGAHLIAEYDRLVRTLLTSCHVGLLDRDPAEKRVHLAARKIRGAFVVPQGYRFLGIDRQSLERDPKTGDKPRQIMGDIPAEVLSGDRRAPLVPRKVSFPTGATGSLVLKPLDPATRETQAKEQNHDT